MKATMFKLVCVMLVLIMMFTISVNASSNGDHYDLYGCVLKSGINNVTCSNRIDVESYPYLWNAVERAIKDWDWHLALLNDMYGFNWNMTSSSAVADSDITIVEKPENFGWNNFFYGLTGHFGFRESDGGNRNTFLNTIDPSSRNWESVVIWIDIEALEDNNYINDVFFCRKLVNHEIGHALGLAHYDEEDAIANGEEIDYGVLMFDNIMQRTAEVPTYADLNGIYELYKNYVPNV